MTATIKGSNLYEPSAQGGPALGRGYQTSQDSLPQVTRFLSPSLSLSVSGPVLSSKAVSSMFLISLFSNGI
jgi:hypothetical protein